MRDGFIIHEKTIRMIDHLDLTSKGYLLECLCDFYADELAMDVVSENDPAVAIIMEDAMDRMRADAEAYERATQQRIEAGKKGADKRWRKDSEAIAKNGEAINRHMANDSESMASDSEMVANDSGSVSVSVNKEKVITNVITKEKDPKHQYGEYKHVLLTDREHEVLEQDWSKELTAEAIDWFDKYIEEKGYKCKSHYLAMRRWVFDAIEKEKQRKPVVRSGTKNTYSDAPKRDYDFAEMEALLIGR